MKPTVLETARTIAARHRIPPGQIRPLPTGGANHVLALGTKLVLRLPRTQGFAADLRKEAALIPAVHRAGVRTPALIDFTDPPGALPHMLIERVPGTDLTHHQPSPRTLTSLGRQLARIHCIPTIELPDLPRNTDISDPSSLLVRLRHLGHIDAEAARWLRSWCEHLTARLPAAPAPTLVHGDLAPQNLVVTTTGDLGGIVDWGDSALADPATDFAKLPPWWLPPVLDGYRRELGQARSHPWEARVLWHHLTWALTCLEDPAPNPGQRHWTAPPSSRLLGLLRLFSSNPPEPWPDLAPRPLHG